MTNFAHVRHSRRTHSSSSPAPCRPRRAVAWALLGVILQLMAAGCAPGAAIQADPRATPAVSTSSSLRLREDVVVHGRSWTIPAYASQSLSRPDPSTVERAVIVIHGSARNADDYFDYAAEGLRDASGVLVVAPEFAIASDSPGRQQLYWTDSGWKQGDESVSVGGRPKVSSFATVDAVVEQLYAGFPSLQSIVFIGHSAGAQFLQRYAATRSDPREVFVIANPSSYMYFGAERPRGSDFTTRSFGCRYNDYKYGLERLNDYMDGIGSRTLEDRYGQARVFYLLGGGDTDPEEPSIDESCPARAQGSNRLARGEAFFRYLAMLYGDDIYGRQHLIVLPGIGHSGRDMITSSVARAIMLGLTPPETR